MNERLSRRISNGSVILAHEFMETMEYDIEAGRKKTEACRQLIINSPNLIIDNVANYYAISEKEVWKMSDAPNWAPPWTYFFVEYNEPHLWNINGNIEEYKEHTQVGHFIFSCEIKEEDKSRANHNGWINLLSTIMGISHRPDVLTDDIKHLFLNTLSNTRWLLITDRWGTTSKKPINGRPMWFGLNHILMIDHTGKMIQCIATGISLNTIREAGGEDAITSPLHILGLGLSFCHCKNVTMTETSSKPSTHPKSNKPNPTIKHYILNIDPFKEAVKKEIGEKTGIKKALHICRGHFATYSKDKPLFGRVVGTVWKPDHIRGSATYGQIKKGYNINN